MRGGVKVMGVGWGPEEGKRSKGIERSVSSRVVWSVFGGAEVKMSDQRGERKLVWRELKMGEVRIEESGIVAKIFADSLSFPFFSGHPFDSEG